MTSTIKNEDPIQIEEGYCPQLPQIRALDVEISNNERTKITVGSLMESQSGPPTKMGDDLAPQKQKKVSKKKFMEEFQKEAGTLREDK